MMPPPTSPIERLHQSLVLLRLAFFSNVTAQVYRRERAGYRDDEFVWSAEEESCQGINSAIRESNEFVRKHNDGVEESEISAEDFAQRFAAFSNEGFTVEKNALLDSIFPEDCGSTSLSDWWKLASEKAAAAMNVAAEAADDAFAGAWNELDKFACPVPAANWWLIIDRAIWDGRSRWSISRIRWSYKRDLELAIRLVRLVFSSKQHTEIHLAVAEDRKNLPPCWREAGASYDYAMKNLPHAEKLSPEQIHKWAIDNYSGTVCNNFETWRRYVRGYNKSTAAPSATQPGGRSLIRQNDM